ncbi:MAG: hypothetical protein DRO39_06940 [Thermoprotei archaeon]|nr:MAG: hypothetical protein DRO39_06940 [Thermoprotei archaeon]
MSEAVKGIGDVLVRLRAVADELGKTAKDLIEADGKLTEIMVDMAKSDAGDWRIPALLRIGELTYESLCEISKSVEAIGLAVKNLEAIRKMMAEAGEEGKKQ